MLIRSRPLTTNPVISRGTNIWVVTVSVLTACAFGLLGFHGERPLAIHYALQAGAFPIVYFCLCAIARRQMAISNPRFPGLPERPWGSISASVYIAFAWGLILLSLYFFMVLSMYPRFMHDFVRTPTIFILTIRNTEFLISSLLCVYVLLDYARLASAARSNLGHRTIATALTLEFLLATHFAVY